MELVRELLNIEQCGWVWSALVDQRRWVKQGEVIAHVQNNITCDPYGILYRVALFQIVAEYTNLLNSSQHSVDHGVQGSLRFLLLTQGIRSRLRTSPLADLKQLEWDQYRSVYSANAGEYARKFVEFAHSFAFHDDDWLSIVRCKPFLPPSFIIPTAPSVKPQRVYTDKLLIPKLLVAHWLLSR